MSWSWLVWMGTPLAILTEPNKDSRDNRKHPWVIRIYAVERKGDKPEPKAFPLYIWHESQALTPAAISAELDRHFTRLGK